MVTVAVRALELEYLVKILDWGRSPSWYIFSRLRLHLKIPSDSTALGITALYIFNNCTNYGARKLDKTMFPFYTKVVLKFYDKPLFW
jgi:hypothetical protein